MSNPKNFLVPHNNKCDCSVCDSQRHDPYFNDRNEFDRVQEDNLFPDIDFDGDILDLL